MLTLLLLLLLSAVLSLAGFWLLGLWQLSTRLIDRWDEWTWQSRSAGWAAVVAVFLLPYLLFKAWELPRVLDRLPEPLEAMWIDYRLEESWGIGLPSDKETGFVVYRLTPASARWARNMGSRLGDRFEERSRTWHPTPIDDEAERMRWHPYDCDGVTPPHPADVREFLNRYGFSIPVAAERVDEANGVIRRPGAFYSYGRSSVTVVDPRGGKVYFFYAG